MPSVSSRSRRSKRSARSTRSKRSGSRIKRRRLQYGTMSTDMSMLTPSLAGVSSVSRGSTGTGNQKVEVVRIQGKGGSRKTRKLSVSSLLAPMQHYFVRGYGHDINTTTSMKVVNWAQGRQSIQTMIMLPCRENYHTTNLQATNSGECPTIDDMLRKAAYANGLSRATLIYQSGSDYYGANNAAGLSSEYIVNNFYNSTMNQNFDFYGGKQVHTFQNIGSSPITFEFFEMVPRYPLDGMGAIVNGAWTVANSPLEYMINDYRTLFANNAMFPLLNKQTGAGGADPALTWPDEMVNGTTTVNDITGGATTTVAPIGHSSAGGVEDPLFRINKNCKSLLQAFKVSKPVRLFLNILRVGAVL